VADSLTKLLILDAVAEEEGNSGDDPSNWNRWLGCYKKAAKLVWDSRSWLFKQVVNEAYSFDPALPDENLLPIDYGNFETMGAGLYYQNPKFRILPWYADQMASAKYGQTFQGSALPRRYSIRPLQVVTAPATQADGRMVLQLYPMPPEVRTLTMVYLRRDPILTLTDTTDELGWIPTQWHSVVDSGARWWNLVKSGSGLATEYKELFKAALQSMSDRERWGGPGLDMASKWRPSRMSSVN